MPIEETAKGRATARLQLARTEMREWLEDLRVLDLQRNGPTHTSREVGQSFEEAYKEVSSIARLATDAYVRAVKEYKDPR